MSDAIYLDYMSTTPVDDAVAAVMAECLGASGVFGNSGNTSHPYGQAALEVVRKARAQVASAIGAAEREIIWTSGATESNNLALKGAATFYRDSGNHIISVETEHKSVLNVLNSLQQDGFSVTLLPVDAEGMIRIDDLRRAIRPQTILISVMHVNNETGVVQDLQAIAQLALEHGILFHVDAAQSMGKVELDVSALPVHLVSFSAHKSYGPKGVGALFVRQTPRVRLSPQLLGGGQEWGVRSGTLATHQIAGMGAAFARTVALAETDRVVVSRCSSLFEKQLLALDGVRILGGKNRYSGCFNLHVKGVLAKQLLHHTPGVAISQGAACSDTSHDVSHVLSSMGLSHSQAQECVRISLGRFTQEKQIIKAAELITSTIASLRRSV